MKLLIITPVLNKKIGGQERFVIEFASELAGRNHDITVLTSDYGTPIKLEKVKIVRHRILIPKYFNKLVKYAHLSLVARKHLRKNKYDYVIAIGYSGFFLDSYIWRASGSPINVIRKQKTGNYSSLTKIGVFIDNFTREYMERRCIRRASMHMFPSRRLKSEFEKAYRFRAKRYFIPCSGIRVIPKKNNDSFPVWKKLRRKIKVLTVSGLSQDNKGKQIILKAMKLIDKENIVIVSVGDIKIS